MEKPLELSNSESELPTHSYCGLAGRGCLVFCTVLTTTEQNPAPPLAVFCDHVAGSESSQVYLPLMITGPGGWAVQVSVSPVAAQRPSACLTPRRPISPGAAFSCDVLIESRQYVRPLVSNT